MDTEDKKELLMSKVDLDAIIDEAKNTMSTKTFPTYLESCKELGMITTLVPQEHERIMAIIEATIVHLNKKGAMKKLAKFNYKENKF